MILSNFFFQKLLVLMWFQIYNHVLSRIMNYDKQKNKLY